MDATDRTAVLCGLVYEANVVLGRLPLLDGLPVERIARAAEELRAAAEALLADGTCKGEEPGGRVDP